MDTPGADETSEINQNMDLLSATELVCLRKPDEEVDRCVIGEKFYGRSDASLENKAVECALESHKDSLSKKRAARVCDLMQAEWKEELNVSLTSKLKGKFIQHMGYAHDGKIALTPEESLFLLENGYIEIKHGQMLLSTEEAYNVMLKENLSAEKYQVYSYLSQLGFIVVSHQTELGVTKYEKKINLDKQPTRKKRKIISSSCEEPEKKRLTFTGAFSKELESEIISDNTESQTNLPSEVVEKDVLSEFPFASINNEQVEKTENTTSIAEVTLTEQGEASEKQLCNDTIQTTTSSEIINKIEDSAKDIVTQSVSSPDANNQIQNDIAEFNDSSNLNSNVTESHNQIDELNTTNVASINQKDVQQPVEDTLPCNENNSTILPQNDKLLSTSDASHSKNDVDVMDVDSQNTEVSCTLDVSQDSFDNNVSNSNANPSQDSSCTVVNNAEMQNLIPEASSNFDVMSCSSNSEENDVISLHANSENSFSHDSHEDSEVELLEVTKKETKPLDVIDIVSDESQGSEFSLADEEIQVVRVCSGLTTKVKSISRTSNSRKPGEFKKEERSSPVTNPKFLTPSLMVQFPDLFRKDVVCVARPPLNLLPNHVKPSKEAYILDLKLKSQQQFQPRIWNSFRDMQEYQRARRRRTHAAQSFSNYRNRNQNPWMDFRPGLSEVAPNYQNHEPSPWLDRSYNLSRDREANYNYGPADSPEVLATSLKNYPLSAHLNAYSSGPSRNPVLEPPRYSFPGAATMNSVVSVSNQDMNVSMVGNHHFNSPLNFNNGSVSNFPPNVPMLSGLGPADIIAEVQRTAYSVATNMLSSMFGRNLPLPNPQSLQQFSTFQPAQNFPPYNFPPRYNGPFNTQNYNAEPFSMHNRRNYRDHYRRPYRGSQFPCHYQGFGNRHSWSEVKEALGENRDSPVGSDVEEVPINPVEVLWDPKGICPLVKPGTKYIIADILKTLQLTRMANLLGNTKSNEKSFPVTCSLVISFDVYLPGTNYKKTCPDIPKHRIIVMRSTDPVPRYSEIAFLQKKWNDGATLQVAVVDNGDITFQSFNSVCLPVIIPHEN